MQTDHQISARRLDKITVNKKKRELAELRTFLSRVTRVKLKESKKDKYLGLALELKNLWKMKVEVIPVVIGARDTVTKGLIQIRGRAETI